MAVQKMSELTGTPDEKLVDRLHRQIMASRKRTQPFENQRADLVTAFAGPGYGNFQGNRTPLNFINHFASTVIPLLVSHNPGVDVSTAYAPLRPIAFILDTALDLLATELKFVTVNRERVTEAVLGGPGFRRLGLGPSGQGPYSEFDAGNGMPFYRHVPLPQMVFDPYCKRLEDAWFMGNEWTISMDLLNAGWYQNADKVQPLKDIEAGEGINKPSDASDATPKPMVDEMFMAQAKVYDIFLPPGNVIGGQTPVIVTIPVEGEGKKPLRVTEWHLPMPPYDWIPFHVVPDNPLPLSPGAAIWHMHDLLNELAIKMADMATRHKKIALYDLAAQGDADNIRKSADGEWVGVTDINQFKEVEIGGFTEKALAAVEWFQEAASRYAGSSDLMAGISPTGSNTATEATYLQQNASMRVRDMVRTLYERAENDVRMFAWMLLTDPDLRIPVPRRIGDIELPIMFDQQFIFEAARAMGIPDAKFDPRFIFAKMHLRIEPDSMGIKSPAERASDALTLFSQIVMPMAQVAMAQGLVPDVRKMMNVAARAMRIEEEVDQLFIEAPPGLTPDMAWNMRAPVLPSQSAPRQAGPNQPAQINAAPARPAPVAAAVAEAGV